MKKKLGLFVKISVSVLLLLFVLSRTDLDAIFASLSTVDARWVLVALALLTLGKFLTGYRWKILLAAHGIEIPFRKLVVSLYVGQFFNSFLPSIIGGDAIRAYDTAKFSDEKTKSVTAVFLDRLIGMFALAFLGIVALFAGLMLQEAVGPFLWLVLLAFAACIVALIAVFNRTIADRFDWLLRRLKLAKVANKFQEASTAVLALRDQKGVLAQAFLLSVVLQINVVVFYYSVGLSLNIGVPLIYFFIIIPIILVILLVPFSINGIGLREGAYVFFLGSLGVTTEKAIAFSWLAFGLFLTQGLLGGILFALRGIELKRLRRDVSAAQPKNIIVK